MYVIEIDNKTFYICEKWSDVFISQGRNLVSLCKEIPKTLKNKYDALVNDKKYKEVYIPLKFAKEVLLCLSNIDKNLINNIRPEDIRYCYKNILELFVLETIYQPTNINRIEKFILFGKEYFLPARKIINNIERPFNYEFASKFCDASDLLLEDKQIYSNANLLIAIVYSEKDKEYKDTNSLELAEKWGDTLTCDIYYSAVAEIRETNNVLNKFFPNLFTNVGVTSKIANEESGLNSFGWLNSMLTVAEKGVFNQNDKTPLDSVRNTNLYDFMTIISQMRATADCERIYQEKSNV